jgi:hypothetical protein
LDTTDLMKNQGVIGAASNNMMDLFGPKFTNTPNGHIETDIAAAASLAGLLILRSKFPVLPDLKPGTVFLSPMDEEMNLIHMFMGGVCNALELEPNGGWNTEIPPANMPLWKIPDMTRKLEKDVLDICNRNKLQKDFFPYTAVLTAMRLVSAGNRVRILDQNIGKSLVAYHVYGGARTIPYS